VNSPANLTEQQHQFLEAKATEYGLTGDTRTVFLRRFAQNENKDNTELARFISWSRTQVNGRQKLQDELKKICQALQQYGCPINKPKRGRQPTGKSPWEQAFKWLWREKFPDWQKQQNLDSPSEEAKKQVVCHFLKHIEYKFKYISLIHRREQPIILQDQYIPIQVTLERQYRHEFETSWGYFESETELKRAYAFKRSEESKPTQMDWKQAKKQHQQIMILADPGMGKSTLLKRESGLTAKKERESLANNCKTIEDVTLPLFIRLDDLAKYTSDTGKIIDAIPRLIEAKYDKHFPAIQSLLEEKLKTGKCLLLLDAVDEVPNNNQQRKQLSDQLNDFLDNYPCHTICTSRIVGYSRFLNRAKEMEIVPFNQKQREQYIETWFKNARGYLEDDTVSAQALIRELRDKPQIDGLAQNPLLLSLICSLYQEKGLTLPARRCQVYEQSVRYMLGKWSKHRNPGLDEAWIDAKTELLEEVAYHFSCQGKDIFTKRELRHQIDRYLRSENAASDFRNKTAACLITELSEQDGILQKLYEDGEQYLFLHRTFQEYLTACYLNQASDCIALAREHFWDYDWHETLSLLAGLIQNPIPLLEAITNEKDDIFSTLLLLAGRCLAECEDNSHPLITEIIDKIYSFWQRYLIADFVQVTVIALGQSSSKMRDKLQNNLNHKERYTRTASAWALGRIGNPQSVSALISILNNEEDDNVIKKVINSLGWIGSEQAIQVLVSILDNEQDRELRYEVVRGLSWVGNSKTEQILISLLKDKDSRVKLAAAEILGQRGNEPAIQELISALEHEDENVRCQGAWGLQELANSATIPALISALDNNDGFVRQVAAETLGLMGDLKAVDALKVALNHKDIHVKAKAVLALERMGNPESVQALIPALCDEDINVIFTAIQALEEISSLDAILTLIAVIKSASIQESFCVRLRAEMAFAKMGIPEFIKAFIFALNHQDWGVKIMAAFSLKYALGERTKVALSQMPPQAVQELISALISALNDEDVLIREAAAWVLIQMGNPQTIPALISALNDEYGNVRRPASAALWQIGTPEILEQLIQRPDIDIYRYDIFLLARRLAIRASLNQEKLPFIPVYPELVDYKQK